MKEDIPGVNWNQSRKRTFSALAQCPLTISLYLPLSGLSKVSQSTIWKNFQDLAYLQSPVLTILYQTFPFHRLTDPYNLSAQKSLLFCCGWLQRYSLSTMNFLWHVSYRQYVNFRLLSHKIAEYKIANLNGMQPHHATYLSFTSSRRSQVSISTAGWLGWLQLDLKPRTSAWERRTLISTLLMCPKYDKQKSKSQWMSHKRLWKMKH